MAENERISITERAKRFLARHAGNAEAAVSELLRDNKKLRDERRTIRESGPYRPDESLQRENAELQTENERLSGLIPPVGAVVLTGDDATAWPKFKALNIAPDKIAEALKERDTLASQVADRDRKDVITRAAEELKWKPTILAKIASAEGLHLEFKDVNQTVDGKQSKVSVPHVRLAKDEKATLEPLAEYAKRELKDYLPALRTTDIADEESEDTDAGGGGVEYLEQQKGGGPPTPPNREKLAAAARASGDYVM